MNMNLLLAMVLAVSSQQPAVDTAVVCPPALRRAIEPWIQYRTAQGHSCVLLRGDQSAEAIRRDIRSAATEHPLRFVLLVGDADPTAASRKDVFLRSTPTHFATAKVNVRWGSEPELATDNWFADLDDDVLPDLAIGRLPVDSPAELEKLVQRIIDYETAAPRGYWKQRINFIAGVGGFGALTDSIIETTTRKFLTDGIPAAYLTNMTYGSWRSPFCPEPHHFHDRAVDRYNEGCLFWVYIGHGQKQALDQVQTPVGSFHIFDVADTDKLRSAKGCPIALFLACHVGAFDSAEDCLAEEMLRSNGGPIAVLSGSRVTMPYAMAVLGDGLMREYFQNRRPTIGEVLQHAKRRLAQPVADSTEAGAEHNRQLLDALARAISPDPDLLADERLEHAQLFNLLGDPLLQLYQPRDLQVQVAETVHAGDRIKVTGSSPLNGKCLVELVSRRDTFKRTFPARSRFDPRPQAMLEYADTYVDANNRSWIGWDGQCEDGTFAAELVIPRDAKGHCHVRVVVDSAQSFALGASNLFVLKPAD